MGVPTLSESGGMELENSGYMAEEHFNGSRVYWMS